MHKIIEIINQQRINQNYLTIEETLALVAYNNQILDVFSLLIDKDATIGSGNCFQANVMIRGKVNIGDDNQFGNGTCILAETDTIRIGSHCRFEGKVLLYDCQIGDGAQVLGFIQAYHCLLESGGSYLEKNPDLRGAVLKGTGRAKHLHIGIGQVINGCGDFKQEDIEWQHIYHPRSNSTNS